ncbi:HET-domain-containing protein [Penicillium manginii]|uniref:HET-domain-containing protein n=1 Tax=Penicillium manginii TaxID=203109 RepID=UPI002546AAB7|nr:HET-domain-containing protein [Penicillium manginii]KAJ5767776.1 HET-domain-containing protein [Penicillium manginii]
MPHEIPSRSGIRIPDSDDVRIMDINSRQRLQLFEGHSNEIHAVALSHDSKFLASASHDDTIRIWDISSGISQCLQTLKSYFIAIRFNSTDSCLVTSKGAIQSSFSEPEPQIYCGYQQDTALTLCCVVPLCPVQVLALLAYLEKSLYSPGQI